MRERFLAPSKYKRRRRWSVRKHAPLKWALALALAAAAVVLAVVLLQSKPAGATAQGSSVAVSLPASTPSALPTAPPTPTPFQKKPASGYLVLINWEHPNPSAERPQGLVTMDTLFTEDLVTVNMEASMNQEAGQALLRMLQAAQDAGVGKYIITSAYRSQSYQQTLYEQMLAENPEFADDPYTNPVKVMPGNCSEHATGLAIDMVTEDYQEANEGYADTEAGRWLRENAPLYGFVLRYPKDKEHITGVIYEPWHIRYVGVDAAREMTELGLCLEEYVEP